MPTRRPWNHSRASLLGEEVVRPRSRILRSTRRTCACCWNGKTCREKLPRKSQSKNMADHLSRSPRPGGAPAHSAPDCHAHLAGLAPDRSGAHQSYARFFGGTTAAGGGTRSCTIAPVAVGTAADARPARVVTHRGRIGAHRPDQVARIALDNAFLTESQLLKTLARETLAAQIVETIATHQKWSKLVNVRVPLLRHPHSPTECAAALAPDLPRREIEDLLGLSRLPGSCARIAAAKLRDE